MPLNNSQYDEIFRSYDAKQLKAQHQLEERTKAAYERSGTEGIRCLYR